ncbi:MAG: energy transducer TonB [Sphingomicrobium sp.]
MILGLEPVPTGKLVRYYLQARRELRKRVDYEPADVTVGADLAEKVQLYVEPVVREGYARYGSTFSDEQFRLLLRTGRLKVHSSRLSADFQLTGLTSVNTMLEECRAAWLEHWGYSRAAQAKIAFYPERLDTEKPLLRAKDYPSRAIDRDAIGTVEVMLDVGRDGIPIRCRNIRESGHKDLDQKVCAAAMHRRYLPGRDVNGEPIAAPNFITVRWAMN